MTCSDANLAARAPPSRARRVCEPSLRRASVAPSHFNRGHAAAAAALASAHWRPSPAAPLPAGALGPLRPSPLRPCPLAPLAAAPLALRPYPLAPLACPISSEAQAQCHPSSPPVSADGLLWTHQDDGEQALQDGGGVGGQDEGGLGQGAAGTAQRQVKSLRARGRRRGSAAAAARRAARGLVVVWCGSWTGGA